MDWFKSIDEIISEKSEQNSKKAYQVNGILEEEHNTQLEKGDKLHNSKICPIHKVPKDSLFGSCPICDKLHFEEHKRFSAIEKKKPLCKKCNTKQFVELYSDRPFITPQGKIYYKYKCKVCVDILYRDADSSDDTRNPIPSDDTFDVLMATSKAYNVDIGI